ncbi:hypothetical protein FJV41_26575 [Myxococcus llanfairpwllgwyngyllgogerychwyrndrobwllllantysiliogogogochensis]|uniref:Lipoprotein n=1 Tax=Myxococcus llanfairpwllgwyngyllgogerychwyrndrobwllllantysiliogogogochensis TaxID=2590453 RepID=A0A540WVE3_9BACT|nr:hypothetical protein [Myxococcus llanfairpwllgwyngyllgogerychwyrndrobwllllantysiliogogogochensis]TQF12927.1 hypothetical protein FJV41_26575 [Myxococcus llanfairpwllgwyngyllgogerychwyrndrobwllllantysiliogogogochensis]
MTHQRSERRLFTRAIHPIVVWACLVAVAVGGMACETEEIRELRNQARLAALHRSELADRIKYRADWERDLRAVEARLRFYCPPVDQEELLSRLTPFVAGADVKVLHESSDGVVLRLQWASRAGDIVDTMLEFAKVVPFLSLNRLSIQREAWSVDVETGPACPTLEEQAARVTRFPLPPRGMLWNETSRKLRAEILAAQRDIQRWESTTLAGGLAVVTSRMVLNDRLRAQQLGGPEHLFGQLRALNGLIEGAVVPEMTLSRIPDGRWLLEGNPAGTDTAWAERMAQAGYRLEGGPEGPQVLIRR